MLNHPEIMRVVAADRVEALRRAARVVRVAPATRIAEADDVELRLCRSADDAALEVLSQLEGRPVPAGRLVVALVSGRIIAAQPLAGGRPLRDPFARTAHLLPLLTLRMEQLRDGDTRHSFLGRALRPVRHSLHA